MSTETKMRVSSAFRAMMALGISRDKVKPVLETLLTLYGKNWALIEEENYRPLLDAIIERDKKETQDHSGKDAKEVEEPERPLKRLKQGYLDGPTSSLDTSNINMSPVCRKDVPSKMHCAKVNGPRSMDKSPQENAEKTTPPPLGVKPQSLDRSKGKHPSSSNYLVRENGDPSHFSSISRSKQSPQVKSETRLPSHPMRLRDRATGAASPQIQSKSKRHVPKKSSHAVRLKEPKVEPHTISSPKQKKTECHALISPKDEPLTDDMPCPKVLFDMAHIDDRVAMAWGISSLKGLIGSRSAAKLPQPKSTALSTPLNSTSGRPQLNKLDAEDETQGKCAEETDGLSLVAVQKPQDTRQIISSNPDVVDIARGQEKFVITLVNEVNDERPPSFCYIRNNAVFQNAYANFSLARIGDYNCCASCSGDCLSLSTPCACSYETGGEFAYTTDGLVKEEFLKESISMNRDPKKHCQFFCKECPLERSKCDDIIEPCKGHLVRRFIKECWIKCGCNIQCGNRVVQRGISRKLQVFMTPNGKGWGLRTLEDLPRGAFVCEYVGEVLTNAELFERVLRSPEGEKHSYPVLLDADWCAEGVLKDEEALCLDATYYGNVARFINHKCYDSNLVEIPVEVETPDHHYYHLAFFTTRKVKAMEELTWDYGIDFDDNEHPIKAFRCQCGSRFCRNIKRSRSRAGRR